MKKTHTSTDIHQKQGQELSKKLYRSISEQAKRLDDARSCARNIGDLFTPNLQVQRRKLCEYCERLIFSEPALYGRKGEELLWRKGFYDVVVTAKKFKNKEYQPDDVSHLQAHINAGIGFYHHLLSKLQWEFNLNLKNVIDFAIFVDIQKDSSTSYNADDLEWAKHAVHQCLIYLGDLSRYKLEIYPNWEPTLATRYYLQAISYKPDYGMPYNQMGNLAINQNNLLDAIYHYIRCLACKFPFDGTVNNLISLFEKNSEFIEQLPEENPNADCIIEPGKSENIKKFLARFFLLIDIWYFDKKVSKVYNLCHQTFKDLEECLTYSKPPASDSGESPTDLDSVETESGFLSYLNNEMLFKLNVICLMTISKLRKANSTQLSTAVSFTLAIYSQLIQNVANHIQECVLNYPLTEENQNQHPNGILKSLMCGGKKKSALKIRRRKKIVKVEDSEESDLSETEGNADYSSSDESYTSDTENVLANSSDEELDNSNKISNDSNTKPLSNNETEIKPTEINDTNVEEKTEKDIINKVQRMDLYDMLEIITEDTPLESIKILNDWLKYDPDVLKSCGSNTRSLLRQITYLLNLININLNHSKINGVSVKISELINKESKIPLSEDVVLKGVDILSNVHNELDWNFMQKKGFSAREEAVLRIIKLISFGKFLTTIEETGVEFDEDKNIFVCNSNDLEEENNKLPASVMEELNIQEDENGGLISKGNNEDKEAESKGGQLTKMKHMGQLWLAAEVRALENRVRGKPSLSPYLVLDADALIKYTFMIKQLVNSRKFIVLVPTAVVSALDDLKREQSEARDAIRWLESQFHRGNRFFRAQRPHERAPIPFIKYPKKKDKEMHIYIQIIECCNFLAEQQKGASNLVTLLIGNQNVLSNGENREFSYVGLAQSAGIAIESITQFYGKWKKSKGKR